MTPAPQVPMEVCLTRKKRRGVEKLREITGRPVGIYHQNEKSWQWVIGAKIWGVGNVSCQGPSL